MNIYQAALNSIKNARDKKKAEEESIEMPTYEDLKTRFPDVSEESLQEAMTKSSSEWSDKARKELFESSLRTGHPDWSEEQIRELVDMKDEEEEPPVNVPEIESKVVDLPPEDVNEKEIEVEHPQNDVTILDENENGEIPPDFDETQVVDPEEPEIGETKVSDEEVNAPAETKPTEEKPKAEEPKEKGKPVKEEKPKAEDKDKEKQGKQYEHYPVGLKVAEDAAGVVGDIGNRVERIGNTQLAGSSGGADEVVRQAAIPHYDYRSFFK